MNKLPGKANNPKHFGYANDGYGKGMRKPHKSAANGGFCLLATFSLVSMIFAPLAWWLS